MHHRMIVTAKVTLLVTLAGVTFSAEAWDPVRDLTGRTLKQHAERRIDRIQNSTEKFLHNPFDYTVNLPLKLMGEVCGAIPQNYEGYLHGQVGTWWTLPPDLIAAVQRYYSVNLQGVRFAVNIRTSNGAAQTFGNSIYFPYAINFANPHDLRWMLHELEHVVQYSGSSWGQSGKLCEYMWKGITSGFDPNSHSMEQAADRKADFVMHMLQTGDSQVTSVQLPQNQIAITNHMPHDTYFFLQTQSFGEMLVLRPFESQVFRGAPADTWFYIEVPNGSTAPRTVYTLSGGTKQHIVRNMQTGMLDVMWSH